MVIIGRVKWFNPEKGFGFIERSVGPDVFVHFSAIQTHGYRSLNDGQKVLYQITRGKHGLMAQNVKPL